MRKKNLRYITFISASIFLIIVILLSILNQQLFFEKTKLINDWLIKYFGSVFSIVGFLTLIGCAIAYFSPLGEIRIGGENAKPRFSKVKSFYIALCTTIAAGIVFWGSVEPIYHLSSPPESMNIAPFSSEAIKFAMETMFLHWGFTPYAIYTLPTIIFAIAYYNMKAPFSVSSQFAPIFPIKNENQILPQVVDSVILFCISAGMAATFSTAALNMGGAVSSITGLPNNVFMWIAVLGAAIVIFVISSASGLNKGIKLLSDANTKIYFILLLIVLFFGPTAFSFNLGTEAFGGYISKFAEKNLFTGAAANDNWPQYWTTFYWANWMSWAPVTACFLGRIAYGHRVKDVIIYNLVWPALFGIVWMTLFSGAAIYYQTTGQIDLYGLLQNGQIAEIPYAIFKEMPLGKLLIPLFFLTTFISLVTAADSTTNSMASLSSNGITLDNEEASLGMKIFWGAGLGIISIVILQLAGIDGIKMLSNLGGAPATIFELLCFISLFFLLKKHKK